ncbi:hypothetical protein GUJ93_ZPchr0003g18379 [Zizania palustris]|uniref:Uncharacterized protein n=1 Tax=Zizania palustris TaxID=103762 RepID=A0A8J5VDK5_ZIZPA|nr:hypothetical protein GUJ93_ZPchr0003g18379 [Zizania palustris]
MATTAARSPSPIPAARSGCGAVRRSADSIPGLRPASPSDSLLRSSSSVCRNASPRAWGAEKENCEQRDAAGRTPKPARSAGGARNFMAPTISAASKAVAPSASPRKKVLGERNERAGNAELAHKPTVGASPASEAGAPRRLRLSFDGAPVVPPAAIPVASHVSRNSFGGEERRVENPVCKEHHHAAAVNATASSEVEPYTAAGTAPYDPKTNYLSPRPQFLHYKPNPRIELYRYGGRRLEDGFASESSSEETDTTTPEVEEVEPAEDEQDQQTHPTSEIGDDTAVPVADACALLLEPPSGSPLARVSTPESARSSPHARVHTPEPTQTSPQARVLTPEPEQGPDSARAPAKKRSSLRFLVPPIAFVLFMAATFICVAPPPDSPVMPQTTLSKVSNFLSVQELYPVEMAAWLKQWPSSSLNLVTSYWEALVSTQEHEIFGPHFAAANLSAAAANADEGSLFGNLAEFEDLCVSVLEPDLKIQEAVLASGSDLIAEIGNVAIARDQESIHNADVEQEAVPERASVIEEVANENDSVFLSDELNVPGTPKENFEMSEDVPGSNGEEMASFIQNLESSQPTVEPEQLENIESSVLPLEQENPEGDRADGEENPEAFYGMQQSELSMWSGYLDKVSKPAAVGIALAAVIVPVVLALLHLRQRQIRAGPIADAPPPAPAEQDEQIVETQSGSGSSEYHHTHVKGSQLETPVADEVGGSGASQYSSGLSSGHARRRNVKEDDSLSLGTVSRRESTAHSTSSYGSFTTYEKISAKKKNKEDEAMTPVRRSSRLRNQNKSPEA